MSDRADALDFSYGPALRGHLLGSFRGEIRPVAVPMLYRLGLLLVAATMVLLPFVYVALIILTGYGVFYHAVHDVTLLHTISDRRAAALAYVGPLFVGVTLVAFMIKPSSLPGRRGALFLRCAATTSPCSSISSSASAGAWERRFPAASTSTASSTPRRASAAACSASSDRTWC